MRVVTARWIGCALPMLEDFVDIIEVDKEHYYPVNQDTTNEQAENYLTNNQHMIGGNTKKDMKEAQDPLGILALVNVRSPDWILSPCECGAEKIYGMRTTHSHWCPKNVQ